MEEKVGNFFLQVETCKKKLHFFLQVALAKKTCKKYLQEKVGNFSVAFFFTTCNLQFFGQLIVASIFTTFTCIVFYNLQFF